MEQKRFRQINNNDNVIEYNLFYNKSTQKNAIQVDEYFKNLSLDPKEALKQQINSYFSQNIVNNQTQNLEEQIKDTITTLFKQWIEDSYKSEIDFFKNILGDNQFGEKYPNLDNETEWKAYYENTNKYFQGLLGIQEKNNTKIPSLVSLFYDKNFVNRLSTVKTSKIISTAIGKYIKELKSDNPDLYGKMVDKNISNDGDDKTFGLKVIKNFFNITEKTLYSDDGEKLINTTYVINNKGINFIKQQLLDSIPMIEKYSDDLMTDKIAKCFKQYEESSKSAEASDKRALQDFVRQFYTLIQTYMKNNNDPNFKEFSSIIETGIGKKDKNSLFTVYESFEVSEKGWGRNINKNIREQTKIDDIVNTLCNFLINQVTDYNKNIIIEETDKKKLKEILKEILENTNNAKKVLSVYNLQGVSGVLGELAAAIKLKLITKEKVKITGSETNASGQLGYDVLLTKEKAQYGFQVKNYISESTKISLYNKTDIKLKNSSALSKYMTQNDQKVLRFILCNHELDKILTNVNLVAGDVDFKQLTTSLLYFIKSFLRINDMTLIKNNDDLKEQIINPEVNFWFLNDKIAPTSYILYKKYSQVWSVLNNQSIEDIAYFSTGNSKITDFNKLPGDGILKYDVNRSNFKSENRPEKTIESNLLNNVKLNVNGIAIPINF